MNKWKLAFWICLILLIIIAALSIYLNLDQGVTITYMREGYEDTANDLKILSTIINETNLSKTDIENLIEKSSVLNEFSIDTISLERIQLVFRDDTLKQVIYQW